MPIPHCPPVKRHSDDSQHHVERNDLQGGTQIAAKFDANTLSLRRGGLLKSQSYGLYSKFKETNKQTSSWCSSVVAALPLSNNNQKMSVSGLLKLVLNGASWDLMQKALCSVALQFARIDGFHRGYRWRMPGPTDD